MEVSEETPEAVAEEEPAQDEVPVEENGGSGDVDLGSEWSRIVSELKRRKQALTAAVYGEARVEGFDGHTLRLIFPEEQSFHVGMAKDRKHADELCKVLEKRLGHRPHLEVRAESEPRSASATPPAPLESPVEEEPPEDEPSPFVEEPPEDESPSLEEEPMTVEESRDESSNGGAEAVEGDDIIRDEREVFEMAREFGLFGPDEGS